MRESGSSALVEVALSIRSRLDSLARRLLLEKDAHVSYAQEGEDRLLVRLLERRPGPGYYVDVGAHHPTRFSNTHLLYRAGWRGLDIDPRPGSARDFARVRPRDVSIELGVAAAAGSLLYYVFSDPALNTFSRERADTLATTTDYRLVETILVPVLPLSQILDRYLPPRQSVDLLAIDTEGLDLDVLESNDWGRFRPALILVEDLLTPTLDEVQASPVVRFLRPLGYRPLAKTMNTIFFASPTFPA